MSEYYENGRRSSGTSRSSYHRLLIARELLREGFRRPLPLRELAAATGLSEFHLLRAYRAAFGETPHQHLTRLRLDHAKRALARGSTVTEVCFDVGYVAFVLMPITPSPMMDEATAATLRGLVEKGNLGPGGLTTDDVQATYEELSAKGVKFVYPPKQQPYGIETIMRDDSGNPFSLVQPRK